jgi:hypothetical protein
MASIKAPKGRIAFSEAEVDSVAILEFVAILVICGCVNGFSELAVCQWQTRKVLNMQAKTSLVFALISCDFGVYIE